jgi:hypothetical protein
MRFGWVAAACASIGCSQLSTSDYGVAAAFAGVAGALQVAEEATQGPEHALMQSAHVQRLLRSGRPLCGWRGGPIMREGRLDLP